MYSFRNTVNTIVPKAKIINALYFTFMIYISYLLLRMPR
jgi:hypothetical protein